MPCAAVLCLVIILHALVFCQVFLFHCLCLLARCMPVCHFGASLSSAEQAMGSPIAGRGLSVAHLAAGVVVSVRTALRASLGAAVSLCRGVSGWWSVPFCQGCALGWSLCQLLDSGWWCYCLAANLSISLEELFCSLNLSAGLKFSFFSQHFALYLRFPFNLSLL